MSKKKLVFSRGRGRGKGSPRGGGGKAKVSIGDDHEEEGKYCEVVKNVFEAHICLLLCCVSLSIVVLAD